MQGSPAVIDALNEVLRNVHALHEQAHLQEHKFEALRYKFAKWFDVIETESHEDLFHPLLNRIAALGGDPTIYQFAWTMDVASADIGQALAGMLTSLQQVHKSYVAACEAAEADDDYVTEKLIWKHLKRVEHWMVKFEARIAQHKKLGPTAFVAEFI